MRSEIDLSEPRDLVYEAFEGEPGPCPQCGGRLLQTNQTYSVSTRRGRKVRDSFVMGSDFGWFCGGCPVVVINSHKVRQMLAHSVPHWDVGNEFCVEGIVDLDAIPENKRHLPLGGDDNPIPLINFKSPHAPPPLNKRDRQKRRKLLASKLKERRKQGKQTALDGA